MKTHLLALSCLLAATQVIAANFTLTSHDIADKQPLKMAQVFADCGGTNTSPNLTWSNPPAGTKSFAITAYDPDAPTGSGWWHWTLVNIPVTVTSLATGVGKENSTLLPQGAVQGRNDFGYAGFGGACPPEGDKPHRYRFTVWALKTDKLPIDNGSSGARVGFLLNANALASATLEPIYSR